MVLAGASGCGDRRPSSSDPQALAIGSEGIPLPPVFPVASGSCTLTDQTGQSTTATWDASTWTFSLGNLYWRVDAYADVREYGQTDGQWREVMDRDRQGAITSFTYEWQGSSYAPDSWDQTNSYNALGQLIGSEQVFRDGSRRVVNAYQYDDAGRLVATTTHTMEADGTASDSSTRYLWNDSLVYGREISDGSHAYSLETRTFDDADRLIRVDIDGAGLGPSIDGTPDLRRSWSYDEAGRPARFQSDGTTALDAPVVDGVPDGTTIFDPACARIAVLPAVLYGFQLWVHYP